MHGVARSLVPREAFEWGEVLPPPRRPAVPLAASAGFNGICNRREPPPNRFGDLLEPPYRTASEAPFLLMHPCPLVSGPTAIAHNGPTSHNSRGWSVIFLMANSCRSAS